MTNFKVYFVIFFKGPGAPSNDACKSVLLATMNQSAESVLRWTSRGIRFSKSPLDHKTFHTTAHFPKNVWTVRFISSPRPCSQPSRHCLCHRRCLFASPPTPPLSFPVHNPPGVRPPAPPPTRAPRPLPMAQPPPGPPPYEPMTPAQWSFGRASNIAGPQWLLTGRPETLFLNAKFPSSFSGHEISDHLYILSFKKVPSPFTR